MNKTEEQKRKLIEYSKCISLGISIFFLVATLIVSIYKFDTSLSLCSCQATTYEPASFLMKTLLYKSKVYAINEVGCGGVNSCLPNSYIFPIDLLSLGAVFFVLFVIINEVGRQKKKTIDKEKERKDKVDTTKPKKKTPVKKKTETKAKVKTKPKAKKKTK